MNITLRWFFLLSALLHATWCIAQPTATGEKQTLTIHSATDLNAFEALIEAFEASHPNIHVRYKEFQSQSLYASLTDGGDPAEAKPSLVISSAMDLQTRLVNDGLAMPLTLDGPTGPAWASWRNEVWGFTFEPVVMVFNRKAMNGNPIPTAREPLLQLMREQPELFAGRVGTYDIAVSGAGYLFATQDAMRSSLHGRLLEAFGRAQAKTYCCSNEILDALATGKLTLGYNLIGSYALKRAQQDPNLIVVMPRDYTLVMSRLAFVPRTAPFPEAGREFLQFLLSQPGQKLISQRSGLIANGVVTNEPLSEQAIREGNQTVFEPIDVGTSLLLYLDAKKRERFLSTWRAAVLGLSN